MSTKANTDTDKNNSYQLINPPMMIQRLSQAVSRARLGTETAEDLKLILEHEALAQALFRHKASL